MDMNKYAGSESKYLKATDLGDKSIKVRIAGVELVEFHDNDDNKKVKPCLKLDGKEKMVVCNSTSIQEMGDAWGYESDGWVGKEIGLHSHFYENYGKHGIVITALGKPEPVYQEEDIPF